MVELIAMAFDIKAIDRRIEKLQQLRQLAQDPEILALLRELADHTNGTTPKKARGGEESQQRSLLQQDQRGTLIDTAEEIVNGSTSGITIPDVTRMLQKMNWPFAGGKPVAAVGTAMRRLAKRKRISVLRESSGGAPTVYGKKEG